MSEEMNVLTKDAIIALRALAHSDPLRVWESTLEDLVADNRLEMIAVSVQYLRGYEFRSGSPGDRKFDKLNSETLWNALPGLTPSQATDERIWVTLALGDYKDYVLKRWAKFAKPQDAVGSKIFVRDTRSLIRDHSISRLWWRSYFASLIPKSSHPDALQLFFDYEDIPGEIAGRSVLVDSRVLASYVKTISNGLEATGEISAGINFDAKKYIQGVGKQLNFLAGRFQLGAVSDDRLKELMEIAHENSMRSALQLSSSSIRPSRAESLD